MKLIGILKWLKWSSESSSGVSTTPTSLEVPSIGGSVSFKINCETGWKIEGAPSYVTVSKTRGFESKTVTLTFEPNDSINDSRSGSLLITNSLGKTATISFTQLAAVTQYTYTFSTSSTSISFANTGETKVASLTSYKTPYVNGSVSGSNINVSYTATASNDWITVSGANITVSENPLNTSRTGSVTFTQADSGKTVTVNITQAASAFTWKYFISASTSQTSYAANYTGTASIAPSAYIQKYLNGVATSETKTVGWQISGSNISWCTVTTDSSEAYVTFSNNNTTSQRSGTITFAPVQQDTSQYPIEGTLPSYVVTFTQSAGAKVYSDVTATLAYSTTAAAAGGTCSPTISYSQTYTWNGVSGSGGSVSISDITVGSYSLQETSGASINSSTGVVTWSSNESNKARTSAAISVTITGLGSKTKTVTATCSQAAGSYTYSDITFSSLSYGTVNSGGGSSSPSISYTQTYGWNGKTSGAGTITGGSNDDSYTSYSASSTTGLTLNTSTGVATWAVNAGTAGKEDSTTRSAKVTATVTRNGKTATKQSTASQTGEVDEGPSSIEYGAWSFSITPSTTSISAAGGSSTITLTRPTRTVKKTYLSGDVVTLTETATTGTFAISRSNSSFTLSATSINMTSSTVPTVTLSVSATGATTASAISSTVTATFTATSPTTGTTTASKTSSAITRAASEVIATNYQFSTFSVGSSSFTAASGTTTLSMVVQRKYTYTANQVGGWTTITPSSGTLSVSAGTGGSVGAITYGSTSTCTITVAANTASSSRTISLSGNYNSNSATASTSITQSADAIKTYGDVIVSLSYPSVGPKTSTMTASPNVSASQTITYVSGTTRAGSISYSYSESTASDYASVNASGVITWNANSGVTSDRTVGITVTAIGEGSKSKTATATATCLKDSISSTTYTISLSASPTGGIAAAGGTSTITRSGSIAYSWTSGYSSSGSFTPSLSISGTGFTLSGTTVTAANNQSSNLRSCTVTASYSGATSKTVTISQNAGYYSYATPTVSLSYSTKNAASGTVSPLISYSQTYGWNGSTSGVGTITSGGSISYSESTAHANASVNTSTGVVTWDANTSSSSRSVGVTATVTLNGKTGSKAATSTQSADAVSSTTYGNVTAGTITNATIPASGTSTNYTATAGNGSQVITYSWVSGKANTSETKSIAPSVASISATASSKGTTTSSVTTVKSQAVTWTGSGDKSASGTMYIYQAANAVTNSAYNAYDGDYWASCSIGSGITAAGGSATVTASAGHTYYYQYLYTSGSVAPSSSTYYSTSKSDTASLSLVTNGNSRFSLGGTTLKHSTMGTNATTDTATVRCTNASSTSIYKDDSISVTNSATYGAVSISSHGSGATISAAGGSAKGSGGSGTQTVSYTSGDSRAGTVTCGTYSTVTVSSKGTSISNTTTAGTSSATLTGEGSKTATVSATIYQAGNYVTGLTLSGGSITYAEFAAAGQTLTPNTNTAMTVTYTFTSGSTTTTAPSSTYGSLTTSTSFAMTAATGFTLNSASTGSITASNNTSTTSRSTTVTRTTSCTWTHTSGYGSSAVSKSGTNSTTIGQAKGSYSYSAWSGGGITISNSSTMLSAGADSRTVTIQPWSRTYGWNGATSGVGTEYYTGTVNVSENGDYTSLSASSYTGSSSAKSLTLTKATCGTTIVSGTTVTITATGPTTTTTSIDQSENIKEDFFFRVSPTSLSFTNSASTQTVTVTSYQEYTSFDFEPMQYQISKNNISWITLNVGSVSPTDKTSTFTVTTYANTGTSSRSGNITITSDGGTNRTLPVTQSAPPILTDNLIQVGSLDDFSFYLEAKYPPNTGLSVYVRLYYHYAGPIDVVMPLSGNYNEYLNKEYNWIEDPSDYMEQEPKITDIDPSSDGMYNYVY